MGINLNQYNRTVGDYIKIKFKGDKNFLTIGEIIKEDETLNLFRIKFIDRNNKQKTYWFNRFSGNVIEKSKGCKSYQDTKTVDENSEKAYFLIIDPVHDFDLIPELDICYNINKENEEEDNNNKNKGKIK